MATTHTTQEVPPSTTVAADVFLDVEDLTAHYGISLSRAYELVKTPGFPRSVVPGMTRIPLLALRAHELADSLGAPVAVPVSLPALVGADMFLNVEDLAIRYGICRSKAYELVKTPGFPRSVIPRMARIPLTALRAYEVSYSLDAPAANEVPALATLTPPPARRAGRPAKAVA